MLVSVVCGRLESKSSSPELSWAVWIFTLCWQFMFLMRCIHWKHLSETYSQVTQQKCCVNMCLMLFIYYIHLYTASINILFFLGVYLIYINGVDKILEINREWMYCILLSTMRTQCGPPFLWVPLAMCIEIQTILGNVLIILYWDSDCILCVSQF